MQFAVKNHFVLSKTARWTTALSQPSHDIDNESNDNIQVLFFFAVCWVIAYVTRLLQWKENRKPRWKVTSGIIWNQLLSVKSVKWPGVGVEGEVYKQLNDLITSYGSSTVIAAYGENYPGKLSNFYPAEVFRPVVGGRKFAKLHRWTFSSKGQTSVSIC